MAAVLWLGRPRLDQLLRHLLLQAPTSASSSPKLAKAELSFETYALVREQIRARALNPIRVKGISREVVPYVVEGWAGDLAGRSMVIQEHVPGLELFLDIDAADELAIESAKRRLTEVLAALDSRENRAAA